MANVSTDLSANEKYIKLAIIFHYLITFFLFFIFNRLHYIYILYKQIEKQQIT